MIQHQTIICSPIEFDKAFKQFKKDNNESLKITSITHHDLYHYILFELEDSDDED